MAIITNIDTVLRHIPVNSNFSYELISPFVDQAEETYLIPLIGREFYEALQDGLVLDETLVKYVERAVSNIAFWLYIPIGNVSISDSGIHITSDSTNKTAFEWQVNKVLNSLSRLGMDNLESMLIHLESNVDDFPAYKNSDVRTANNEFYIRSAAEFNNHYTIDRNRLTFACLETICRQVQRELIKPLLGDLLFTDLDENAKMCIKNAIAYQTIAEAIPQLAVEVTHMGLSANYLSMINNISYKTPASDSRIQMLLSHVKEKATSYFKEIPTLLPGYEESATGGTIDPTDLKIFPFF